MIDSAQSDFYGVYIFIKALLVPKGSISFYFKRFKLQSVAFLTYTIITTALLHFLDLSHAYFTNQGSTFLLILSVCLFEVLLLQPYLLSSCHDIQPAFFSYVTEISGFYGCFYLRICFKMATYYSGHDCGISLFIMIREQDFKVNKITSSQNCVRYILLFEAKCCICTTYLLLITL